MPLSCNCDYDYDYYYTPPEDFSKTSIKGNCESCGKVVKINSICLEFRTYEYDDEGEEVERGTEFMCEVCGEIFFNLSALGYCITLGQDDMRELLADYQDNAKNNGLFQREEES